MKVFKTISFIAIIMLSFNSNGQQHAQFSQYMYNTISINPAYAGSREIMVINLLNRNQWIGVNGAPITQTFSAHTSIPNTKLGVGLSFLNDKLGYEKTTYAYADVSYYLNIKGQFQDYTKNLGKNTRLKLLNRRKNLQQIGEVTYKRMLAGNIDEQFALLNQLHKKRWGKAIFANKRLEFNKTVAKRS